MTIMMMVVAARLGAEQPRGGHRAEAYIEGQWWPIVAVHGDTPMAQFGNKVVKVKDDAPIRFVASNLSTSGQVTISDIDYTSTTVTREDRGETQTVGDMGERLSAKLTASEAHEGCYVAAVFWYKDARIGSQFGQVGVLFREVGHLNPDKAKSFKINVGERIGLQLRARISCFLLVFADGHEVTTNKSAGAAKILTDVALINHQIRVQEYIARHPTEDHALTVYSQPKLHLTPSVPGYDALPATVNAELTVGTDGLVSEVKFSPALESWANDLVTRSIEAWRFEPRLKQGDPVATKVTVPIALKPAASKTAQSDAAKH